MAVSVGFDPDTTNLAWARVTHRKVLEVGMIRKRLKSQRGSILELTAMALPGILSKPCDTVVIESQKYYADSPTPARDLITLAHVSGGLEGQVHIITGGVRVLVVEPRAWKGSVPKRIHQARVLKRFGIPFEQLSDYCRPVESSELRDIDGHAEVNPGDWKHICDAIGLAEYGLTFSPA